ncbi:1-acyl-sn-glycerol-3-phosphate acyltransferase [Massilia sp. G4R7]|uniref:1-acyl-sn-glycerol-3-phosphate acyltransferase n=1 Tax=Massilia phyllostachyos TaxID=2898585 RepID=A0ABS8Q5T1_9BURK|nr:1-acyl-sn-glycerol-3-phosphate acyltransferase [Massilia phyllostachyos]MCD2516427.1 1-acyl-sn-glycerol-3-phosphate acyltransferase [Massilia phyllostachyos]
MDDFTLRPSALPTWSQRTALRLLNLAGWTLRYKPLPGPHGIAVVYPHTSNWDFPIGLLGKWALGLKFRWIAKDSLFRGPMGAIMRYWGGIAIDRRASMGATRQLAQTMLDEKWCWIAITPEGTRSYRPHWKSGFYHLATTARVPLLLVYIDYRAKVLSVADTLTLSGDQEQDMAAIAAVYEGRQGLYPDQAAPIKLAPPRDPSEPQRRRA